MPKNNKKTIKPNSDSCNSEYIEAAAIAKKEIQRLTKNITDGIPITNDIDFDPKKPPVTLLVNEDKMLNINEKNEDSIIISKQPVYAIYLNEILPNIPVEVFSNYLNYVSIHRGIVIDEESINELIETLVGQTEEEAIEYLKSFYESYEKSKEQIQSENLTEQKANEANLINSASKESVVAVPPENEENLTREIFLSYENYVEAHDQQQRHFSNEQRTAHNSRMCVKLNLQFLRTTHQKYSQSLNVSFCNFNDMPSKICEEPLELSEELSFLVYKEFLSKIGLIDESNHSAMKSSSPTHKTMNTSVNEVVDNVDTKIGEESIGHEEPIHSFVEIQQLEQAIQNSMADLEPANHKNSVAKRAQQGVQLHQTALRMSREFPQIFYDDILSILINCNENELKTRQNLQQLSNQKASANSSSNCRNAQKSCNLAQLARTIDGLTARSNHLQNALQTLQLTSIGGGGGGGGGGSGRANQRHIKEYYRGELERVGRELVWFQSLKERVVAASRLREDGRIYLDLHGYTVAEAMQTLVNHLQLLSTVGGVRGVGGGDTIRTIQVITGVGTHSPRGIPKIKNAIIKFLRENWKKYYFKENNGEVYIQHRR